MKCLDKKNNNKNALPSERQSKSNQAITARYEGLSYFEREEVLRWIKFNWSKVPLITKVKRQGLEEIQIGEPKGHAAFTLLRYALKALGL